MGRVEGGQDSGSTVYMFCIRYMHGSLLTPFFLQGVLFFRTKGPSFSDCWGHFPSPGCGTRSASQHPQDVTKVRAYDEGSLS